jgi:hypothetical protein
VDRRTIKLHPPRQALIELRPVAADLQSKPKRKSLRHPNLSPLMQAVLLSTVVILSALVLVRVVVLLRNQYAGLSYRYPGSWSTEQITAFERLRLSIGGCLTITWLAFLIATPQLSVSWPFGFEQALFTTALLLLTNAWLLLLMRCNWQNSILGRWRPPIGFAIVALWWAILLSAVLVSIGWATTNHIHLVFPSPTVA